MSEAVADPKANKGPVGIGGWLVLPMLGLFLTPVIGLAEMGTYGEVSENWPYLTLAQSAFVIVEFTLNVVLVFLAPATLLFFMFKRLEIFPGWYMIWQAIVPVFLIGDALVAYAMFPEAFAGGVEQVFDEKTRGNILRAVVGAVIWIPYMMRSVRVANTFVR